MPDNSSPAKTRKCSGKKKKKGDEWIEVKRERTKKVPVTSLDQEVPIAEVIFDIKELRKRAKQAVDNLPQIPNDTKMFTRYVTIAVDGSYATEKAGVGACSDDNQLIMKKDYPIYIGENFKLNGPTYYELRAVVSCLEKAVEIKGWREYGLVILTDSVNLLNALACLGGSDDEHHEYFGLEFSETFKEDLTQLCQLAGSFPKGVWITHVPRNTIAIHKNADNYSRVKGRSAKHQGTDRRMTVFLSSSGSDKTCPNQRELPKRIQSDEGCGSTERYLKKPIEIFLRDRLTYTYDGSRSIPVKFDEYFR